MPEVDADFATALRRAAVRAARARSVQDTQPWHIVQREYVLEIRADWTRQLPLVDPSGRQLLLSCGCAVFNARIAFAAAGVAVDVDRFPDPEQPDLVARLVAAGTGTSNQPTLTRLERADPRQPGGERGTRPLPTVLVDAARAEGADLVIVRSPEHRAAQPASDGHHLLLLGTNADTPLAWARAGEALQRVDLEATLRGQVLSWYPHLIEVPESRARLRARLRLAMHPHLVLRLGETTPADAAPRRLLADVLS
jgi:hypothetical protein